MSKTDLSAYEIAVQQFDRAAEYLDLKSGIREMLRKSSFGMSTRSTSSLRRS